MHEDFLGEVMNKKKEKLENAVGLLKLLSHPVRLSILCNLLHQGEMSVADIVEAEAGAASQSQISQFLAKMHSEDLVKTRKEAQTVFYTLSSPQAKKVVRSLYNIFCASSK